VPRSSSELLGSYEPLNPRRGPDAGSPRKGDSDDFQVLGVNARSYAFLQNKVEQKFVMRNESSPIRSPLATTET